jgi:hypothetical protein
VLNALTFTRLMWASEQRLLQASQSEDSREAMVADRVLSNPSTQRLWHSAHSGYMHDVADHRRPGRQVTALRSVSMRLIHRKALFEYLRDDAVRGSGRRKIVALFHGSRPYIEALVAEHRTFILCACSQLCTTHIGSTLIADPEFDEDLRHYEALYLEYLRLFCAVRALEPGQPQPAHELLPYLKFKVNEARQAILDMRRIADRPNAADHIGDTVRLRSLG